MTDNNNKESAAADPKITMATRTTTLKTSSIKLRTIIDITIMS